MIQFFQTHMGRKFIEGDIPRIAKSLEGIHEELRRANDLKEKELKEEPSLIPIKVKVNGSNTEVVLTIDEFKHYVQNYATIGVYESYIERLTILDSSSNDIVLRVSKHKAIEFEAYHDLAKKYCDTFIYTHTHD